MKTIIALKNSKMKESFHDKFQNLNIKSWFYGNSSKEEKAYWEDVARKVDPHSSPDSERKGAAKKDNLASSFIPFSLDGME